MTSVGLTQYLSSLFPTAANTLPSSYFTEQSKTVLVAVLAAMTQTMTIWCSVENAVSGGIMFVVN